MPNPTLNSYFKMLDRLVVSRLSSKLEVSRKALLVIRLPV